jgi:hypothetical protein
MDLKFFLNQNILDGSRQFFKEILGINIAPASMTEINLQKFLKDQLSDLKLLSKVVDARIIGMINTLSINGSTAIADTDMLLKNPFEDYDMLLVFAIDIEKNITKADISRFTRALNQRSFNRPIVLLIRYGTLISISAAERGKYERPSQPGEKVGRISILKDININHVHAGHERILNQLKIDRLVSSFKDLYDRWHKVFDLKILNKDFYDRIASWYGKAITEVRFPYSYYASLPDNKDKSESEIQEIANQIACIRLLTRIIFVWFLKHKRRGDSTLIPEKIFNKNYFDSLLNYSDNHQSTYYKAILQNLFFATFNTNIDSDQRAISRQNNNDHIMPRFRYFRFFKNPDKAIVELFADIPFLNGGLFENLDINHNTRIDWFSDPDLTKPNTKENKLIVPDHLFFGNDENEGLFDIFNQYYFTIEENTPLSQEIALDPELLGKIFENLLAAYLPESKTSARRKTGSYYTPREVVNYMVDESLIEYLKTKLNSQIIKDLNSKLRSLFSYESDINPFNAYEEVTNSIIKSLSECKILDPACGSGAFPMGMLHQIVHALGKLDPGNERWEHEQLEILIKPKMDDLIIVQKISSENARKEAEKQLKKEIDEIRETFRKNDPDYTRKLYLIQNCIFGVDIQPVAIHISKLRFFISLMVNQVIDEKDRKNNFGIKPLPNLETKFVAANTLKQLKTPTARSEDVIKVEKQIKELRKSFFYTRNRPEKLKLERQDDFLRHELQRLLADLFQKDNREFLAQIENHQIKLNLLKKENSKQSLSEKQKTAIQKEIKSLTKKNETLDAKILDNKQVDSIADQVAHWNPYDQNSHAEWFDPEWMFGFNSQSGAFDIILGNPPYGGFKLEEEICETLSLESKDPYGAFIARFLGSGGRSTPLKNNGLLAYIVSDTFMTIKSHLPLRKQMMDNYIHKMIRVHSDTFGATVNTAIILCRRNEFGKDNENQIVRSFQEAHHCQMVDMTNVSIHENYGRFIEILQQTEIENERNQVSTPEYAIYFYPQALIRTNSNLPFFVASPKLFSLMNDAGVGLKKIMREVSGKNLSIRKIELNEQLIDVVKLGEIADVRQGLATGDNDSYLFQTPSARGNYRSIEDFQDHLLNDIDLKKIRTNDKLRLSVIDNGISKEDKKSPRYFSGRYIVPYDKGGESDSESGWMPNYYVPTNYFIDWSEWAVKRMRTLTIGDRDNTSDNKICSRFQNVEYSFTNFYTYSRTGVYAPTFRIGSRGCFDTKSNAIVISKKTFPILTSNLFKYLFKNYLIHTVQAEGDTLTEMPIVAFSNSDKLDNLSDSIILKQKNNPNYNYACNEQIQINQCVYDAYGLNIEDINEVENWYSRRYPKLSAAQKANLRKLGKSDDYLVLYGLK